MALTPRSWAIFWRSASFPLYRKAVFRAVTRSPRSCARLLIRLSAIPSLRYSVLGSPLALTKGSTARESMDLAGARKKVNHAATESSAARVTPTVASATLLRLQRGHVVDKATLDAVV